MSDDDDDDDDENNDDDDDDHNHHHHHHLEKSEAGERARISITYCIIQYHQLLGGPLGRLFCTP